MASALLLIPIQPGKTAAWEAFVAEAHGSRTSEHHASRQRAGVTHEILGIAQTPQGDYACIVREAADIDAAHNALLTSSDPYDQWFRDKLNELYGTSTDGLKALASSAKVHAEYRPSGS